ncbi:MAG TPA: ATP-binding protein [bacterium]|nr:ATP-binding protein [bacterium]
MKLEFSFAQRARARRPRQPLKIRRGHVSKHGAQTQEYVILCDHLCMEADQIEKPTMPRLAEGMMTGTWTLSINLETEPETLRVARRMIYASVKQEGLSDEKARELELATGEAPSNARAHAYADGVGPVTVDFAAQPEAFVVAIRNAGAAVSPPEVPTSLPSYPAGWDST